MPDRRFLVLCSLLPLLLFLSGVSALGQETDQGARVQGFVRSASAGQALPGANVVLRDTDGDIQSAGATNAEGFYQSSELAPGEYRLEISFVGYQAYRDTLDLAAGEQRTVSVSLSSSSRELEEVTIEGRRPVEQAQAGLQQIQSAELEDIPTPGPGSDLSSYLRSLPGVATTGDRGGRLYVRGGTPSQNLVLVDGIPIHKPFHIVGLYSAFPSDLVSSANFYAGGFGGEYTGRVSSVLDVQLRPGNTQNYEGSVGAGLFMASARAEGPIRQGSSSFLVRARHSLIEHTGPDLLGQETPYRFYDLTAKYHSQGESSQCSIVGMRTYDRGSIDPNRDASFRWSNTAVGGQCLFFSNVSSQVFDTNFGITQFDNSLRTTDGSERAADTWRFFTKLNLERPGLWGNTVRWGLTLQVDQYDLQLDNPFLGLSADDYFLLTASPYLGADISWGNQFTFTPSLGVQFLFFRGNPTFEPRVRFSYRPGGSDDMKLTAAGGLYQQFVTGVTDERDAGSSFQAVIPTPSQDQLMQSTHALLGWDQQLRADLLLSVEGWYKRFRNLPVSRWSPMIRFNATSDLAQADGTAFGADLSLEYERGNVQVGANYGYGQTTYRASRGDLGAWSGGSVVEYAPPYDLRHKLGINTSLNLDWITASVRWQYNSGLPFTQVYGFDTMLEVRGGRDTPSGNVGIPRALYHQPYNARLPSYHRLDVSLERSFDVTDSVSLSVEGGAINAYNRANVFYVDIFTLDRVDQLPMIPYLSLTMDLH